MSVPMDHNNQDNYDMLMGSPMDPGDHSIDNIPEASIQHDGTEMPTQGSPQPVQQTSKPGSNAAIGQQVLEKLKEHMQGGSTKTSARADTKGKKK